jgi:hypothetical protein
MSRQEFLDGIPHVFEEVPAVGNLDSVRRSGRAATGIRRTPITTDDLHAGMIVQPRGKRLFAALWEQINGHPALQINQDGAHVPATPK